MTHPAPFALSSVPTAGKKARIRRPVATVTMGMMGIRYRRAPAQAILSFCSTGQPRLFRQLQFPASRRCVTLSPLDEDSRSPLVRSRQTHSYEETRLQETHAETFLPVRRLPPEMRRLRDDHSRHGPRTVLRSVRRSVRGRVRRRASCSRAAPAAGASSGKADPRRGQHPRHRTQAARRGTRPRQAVGKARTGRANRFIQRQGQRSPDVRRRRTRRQGVR